MRAFLFQRKLLFSDPRLYFQSNSRPFILEASFQSVQAFYFIQTLLFQRIFKPIQGFYIWYSMLFERFMNLYSSKQLNTFILKQAF